MNRHLVARFVSSAVACVLVLSAFLVPGTSNVAAQQPDCRTFEETSKSVCGKFLAYWQEHGGLPQQGYPISETLEERSETDGKTYTVQYFERAVFELHPENQPPFDVLLSLLGSAEYKRKYPDGAPGQQPNNIPASLQFPETGKRLGGKFLDYWQRNGGLMQQGFPISDEFEERSELNGKAYRVQYFERAVFELHPENQAPYDVLLSHLGRLRFEKTYINCDNHHRLRGTRIAEGVDEIPSARFKLTEYWIEEVELPQAITCQVPIPYAPNGGLTQQTRTFDRFYRVFILGQAIPDGSMPLLIFLDENTLAFFDFGVVYDPTLLRDGGALGVGTLTGMKDYFSTKLRLSTTRGTTPTATVAVSLATPTPDAWAELRRRPLNLPHLEPGAVCPVTPRQRMPTRGPNTQDFYVLGNGPVYPNALTFGEDTTIKLKPHMLRPNGWYVEKVAWLTDDSYVGPVLIRARQLDGQGEVWMRMEYEGPKPDVALDAAAPGYFWPGETHLRGPGCYAYQVDGNGFSYLLVFKAALEGAPAASPTP